VPTGKETREVNAKRQELRRDFTKLTRNLVVLRQNTRSLVVRAMTEKDSVVQFAMLEEAYQQAVSLDDSTVARMALNELVARFELDELERNVQFAEDFARKAITPKGRLLVGNYAATLFEGAMAEERIAEAETIKDLVSDLSRGADDEGLREKATELKRRINEYRAAQRAAESPTP
jgi:hypothetical protein